MSERPDFVQVYRHTIKKNVWVRPEIEGTQGFHSLCAACSRCEGCVTLAKLVDLRDGGVVAPVYECPNFVEHVDADAAS